MLINSLYSMLRKYSLDFIYVEGYPGPMEKERLVSICDECDWYEDDILECILLKVALTARMLLPIPILNKFK